MFLNTINKIPRVSFELLAVFLILAIVYYFFENSKNQLLPMLSLYGIALIRLIPSYASMSTSIMNLRFFKISFDEITKEISSMNYENDTKNYDTNSHQFNYKNFYVSTYAYAVNKHRHVGEIDQELKKITKKISFTFNPHLIPTFRGILSSIYFDKKKNISIKRIINTLKSFYREDSFIKIHKLNSQIGTGNVLKTNNCEISVCQTRLKDKIVIFSAIDNLIKGAAGQAIQNMNLMFNFKETLGLK